MDKLDIKRFSTLARKKLIKEIEGKSEELGIIAEEVEEVAFAYFFRAIVTYYMEVNGYLSPSKGIPSQIEDLLPNTGVREELIINDMIKLIPKEDFKEVEVIGWLYQHYMSERKDKVFTDLKKKRRVERQDVSAVTQLFTPKWIVEYMVENSLGRLWLGVYPSDELVKRWKYYLPEAEMKLEKFKNKNLNPEEIKVIDPCMGAGHILVYAFDVLYQIYIEAGYCKSDIPRLIIEKNLYGLDIDERAGQLANFAIMMKARSYDSHIFDKLIKTNLIVIEESNRISKETIDFFIGDELNRESVEELFNTFLDAKIYGSILQVDTYDFEALLKRATKLSENMNEYNISTLQHQKIIKNKIIPIIKQVQIMNQQYDVVVTNPPYMGIRKMDVKLVDYVKKYYPDSKTDLFAVFMEVANKFTKNDFYTAMINQQSWMFLSSFKNLRKKIINQSSIINMIHLGTNAFPEIEGEIVQSTAYVLRKLKVDNYKTTYIRLVDINNSEEKAKEFFNNSLYFISEQKHIADIQDTPIAYWMSNRVRELFKNYNGLKNLATPKMGSKTGDNGRFLRLWHEVKIDSVNFGAEKIEKEKTVVKRWFPYNKGGGYRKWYGLNEYLIDWKNDGEEIRLCPASAIANYDYFLESGLTWSSVSASKFSIRIFGKGFIFDGGGACLFTDEKDRLYLLGLLNSKVFSHIFTGLNPTINFQSGAVGKFPTIITHNENIDKLVSELVKISKEDWDSYETSWDFQKHFFLNHAKESPYLKDKYEAWESYSKANFLKAMEYEKELNKIFIDIYGLQDETIPEVPEKEISIRLPDRVNDTKSFLSYLVGVIMGRYSLDIDELVYAGGEWNDIKYQTFQPQKEGMIVLTATRYFQDDLLTRIQELLVQMFGYETLNENIKWIAESLTLATNELSIERLGRYFLNEFIKDHFEIYKNRPIYWLFDSGNKSGFKSLIYIHRYNELTVFKMYTSYLKPLQEKYEIEIARLDDMSKLQYISIPEREKLSKRKEGILEQLEECKEYSFILSSVANQQIKIDLDDGVKQNYKKFQGLLKP